MSRIPPLAGPFSGADFPKATLRTQAIYDALRRHGVLEERDSEVIATLQHAADDYLLTRAWEEAGATRAEIHQHSQRMTRLASQLSELRKEAAVWRIVSQRVHLGGGPSADRMREIEEDIWDYATRAAQFASSIGTPKREAPSVAAHARQVRLAKKLLNWFSDVGLPGGRTQSSLMAQLLAALLDSVGEAHSKPQDLLDQALWGEHREFRSPKKPGRKANTGE